VERTGRRQAKLADASGQGPERGTGRERERVREERGSFGERASNGFVPGGTDRRKL
jgi:hypothetical protein